MMKLLSKNYSPKMIFFIDGVNEVLHKCRVENNYYSSGRENYIRDLIIAEEKMQIKYQTKKLFQPTIKIIKKIQNKIKVKENDNLKKVKKFNLLYDCDKNFEKVNDIVNSMILDWNSAKKIAEEKNIKFIPVLQPNIFLGNPKKENLNKSLSKQYLKFHFINVYSKITEKLEERNIEYLNLLDIFDDNNIYYIDFAHVSPNGNKKIADLISSLYFK